MEMTLHRMLALVSLLAACESQVTTSSPSSVTSSSAVGSGSATVTTAATGAGGWGGGSAAGGAGGASALEMVINGQARPVEHVTLTTTASEFIGGINRWVFDFRWLYDDPMIEDEMEWVDLTVRIMRTDPMFEPTAREVTYVYPNASGNPLEMLPGSRVLFGVVMTTTTIEPFSGIFSIRRVGDQFEGYVSIDAEAQDRQLHVHVAGPFQAPVP